MLTNEQKMVVSHALKLQRGLKTVFLREEISARVLRIKQGPMTITFQLALAEASRKQLNAIKNLNEVIEHATAEGPVRVQSLPGMILIEFPSPVPYSPSAHVLAKHAQGSTLIMGMDQFDQPVPFHFARNPNVAFIGPPMHGKTSAMRALLYQAIKGGVEYIIIAERMVSWQVFTRLQGCIAVIGTADQGEKTLIDLEHQMQEHANQATKFTPRLIVVLDDLISLLDAKPSLAGSIKRLASAGGQVGLFFLMGTQSAGSREGMGGMLVEHLFTTRVVYRMPGNQAAYLATGQGATDIASLSDLPGDAVFFVGSNRTRLATAFVDDEELLDELPKYVGREPSPLGFRFDPPDTPAQSAQEDEDEENRVVPVGLPIIKPARIPTEMEVQQIIAYLVRNPISQNQLMVQVFGNKGSGPKGKLIAGFGEERWYQYFPSKTIVSDLTA